MILELIDFAERVRGEGGVTSSREMSEPVIVITTRLEESGLEYESSALLEKEKDIFDFVKSVPDLELPSSANGFKGWIRIKKNIRGGNKCLGSTGGLMNSVPYVAQLSEKNTTDFETKAAKMDSPKEGWKTCPELQDKLTADMREVYLTFWKENKVPAEKSKDAFLFVLIPSEVSGVPRKVIYDSFAKDRLDEWENAEHCTKEARVCPICGVEAILGITEDSTYQDKKPFAMRQNRPDSYGFRLCNSCMSQYMEAKKTLSRFRIFPLFKTGQVPDEMKFIHDDGTPNRFVKIIEKMMALTRQNEFDFELIGIDYDGIWLYDYITGYRPYLDENYSYSRFLAEKDAWASLGFERFYPYFEDSPKAIAAKNNLIRAVVYGLREKIFSFVYRGDDLALAREDVAMALDRNIRSILTETERPEKACIGAIQSAFRIMKFLRCKHMEVTKKDQENALRLGRAFRVVTKLSEAGNKHGLLNLALDKPRMDGVKGVLSRLLDKFHHKFGELKQEDQRLISECLKAKYDADMFEPLKVYFYAGYFEVSE